MGKVKSVVWRLYLTLLVVLGIAVVWSLVIDVGAYRKQLSMRASVEKYLNIIKDPNFSEWVDDPNAEKTPHDSSLDQYAKSLRKKEIQCLTNAMETGVRLSDCYPEQGYFPKDLTDAGLSNWSSVSSRFWPDITFVWLGILGALLFARYWGAWLINGKFPRTFP